MKLAISVFILLLNYNLLHVSLWEHSRGSFNFSDVGLFCTLFYVFYLILFNRKIFINRFSLSIIILLFLVVFHIPYAVLKYDIRNIDAIISSRKFLIYLNFFIFLDVFKTEKTIRRFMDIMIVISFISIVLGITNFLGINIIYRKEVADLEDPMIRYGIMRPYFPMYWGIVFTSIYSIALYFSKENCRWFHPLYMFISFGVILFRQTRMVIGCYCVVAGISLLKHLNKIKAWLLIGFGSLAVIIISMNIHTSAIYKEIYKQTKTEVTESTGSWGGRLEQFEIAWDLIKKNFLIGAGTSALRSNIEAYNYKTSNEIKKLVNYSLSADLGYAVWVKNFGLVGIALLIFIAKTAFVYIRNLKLKNIAPVFTEFARNYILYVAISFITLNHLGHSEGILFITIVMAILQSLHDNLNAEK